MSPQLNTGLCVIAVMACIVCGASEQNSTADYDTSWSMSTQDVSSSSNATQQSPTADYNTSSPMSTQVVPGSSNTTQQSPTAYYDTSSPMSTQEVSSSSNTTQQSPTAYYDTSSPMSTQEVSSSSDTIPTVSSTESVQSSVSTLPAGSTETLAPSSAEPTDTKPSEQTTDYATTMAASASPARSEAPRIDTSASAGDEEISTAGSVSASTSGVKDADESGKQGDTKALENRIKDLESERDTLTVAVAVVAAVLGLVLLALLIYRLVVCSRADEKNDNDIDYDMKRKARHSRHKYRPEIFPGEADSSKNRASEGVLSLELSSFNNNDAMASFLQENDGAKQETQVEVQAREPGLESSKTNGDIAEVTKSENENKAAFTEVDLGGQE